MTKSLRLLGATTATTDPVTMAHPQSHLARPLRNRRPPPSWRWPTDRPELLEPVIAGLPYTGAEMVYAAREEMAQTLDDVLARRTRAKIQRAQPTMAAAHAAATLIAPEMGWDEQQAADQATDFIEACQKELLTAGLDLP